MDTGPIVRGEAHGGPVRGHQQVAGQDAPVGIQDDQVERTDREVGENGGPDRHPEYRQRPKVDSEELPAFRLDH